MTYDLPMLVCGVRVSNFVVVTHVCRRFKHGHQVIYRRHGTWEPGRMALTRFNTKATRVAAAGDWK